MRGGKLVQAHELIAGACKSYPKDVRLWVELANINRKLGRNSLAMQYAQHAISLQPGNANARIEYGIALQGQGRIGEAVSSYLKALEISPDKVDANYFLATAFHESDHIENAIQYYRRTIEISPRYIEALNNLSGLLVDKGEIQESIRLLDRALKIKPNAYHMMINLSRAHLFSGNSVEAYRLLCKVTRLYPASAEAYSKYLLCSNYLSEPDPGKLYAAHRDWGVRYESKVSSYTTYSNSLVKDRPLVIGYLSPDFRSHSVASFVEPVLAAHNKGRFIINCYSDVENEDKISRKLASLCKNWQRTSGISDKNLCEKIRADKVDILVDLAGHTARNRLLLFSAKPAPIAVSYLGYPNTTGLTAIDYRITDQIADPEDINDAYFTEHLVRLDDGFLCYKPPVDAPDCLQQSEKTSGHIVFGSCNNLAKITTEVIHAWSKVLVCVEGSCLLLKSKATSDKYTRDRLRSLFLEQGVEPGQLEFLGYSERKSEHLNVYRQVDIALDTFPYNGTTTTCEALWMGVPVVTMCGFVHSSRVSASLLSRLGMEQLVASSRDEYIDIATRLAKDNGWLRSISVGLREKMRHSSICDAEKFTTNLEQAYTSIWSRYCENNTAKLP